MGHGEAGHFSIESGLSTAPVDRACGCRRVKALLASPVFASDVTAFRAEMAQFMYEYSRYKPILSRFGKVLIIEDQWPKKLFEILAQCMEGTR